MALRYVEQAEQRDGLLMGSHMSQRQEHFMVTQFLTARTKLNLSSATFCGGRREARWGVEGRAGTGTGQLCHPRDSYGVYHSQTQAEKRDHAPASALGVALLAMFDGTRRLWTRAPAAGRPTYGYNFQIRAEEPPGRY